MPRGRSPYPKWRAYCECGWHSANYALEATAVQQLLRHGRAEARLARANGAYWA